MERLALSPEDTNRHTAHQAALAANFHRNVQPFLTNTSDKLELSPHQPDWLRQIDGVLQEPPPPLGKSLLIPSPPNAGKSTMAALCMELSGVGSRVPETGEKLRALSVVPRIVAGRQTTETYDWIAPKLLVAPYESSTVPELHNHIDVLLLTYNAIAKMDTDTWLRLTKRRDVFVLDETHRGIGEQTLGKLMLSRRVQQPTVMALSATPNFTNIHSVKNRLKIENIVDAPTPREAVEVGISNEVKLYAFATQERLELTSKRKNTITENDLKPLIYREGRNKLILELMQSFVSAGRNGIVQLVPGGQSLHARNIAHAANALRITDFYTGEKRNLRVKAVSNYISARENMSIIDEFKDGGLDALTFTQYLTEAFDHPIGFVLGASPVGSFVNISQLAGRGARFYPTYTILANLVDYYTSSRTAKSIFTFFNVFGQDQLYQGEQISRKGTSYDGPIRRQRPGSYRTRAYREHCPPADEEFFFSPAVQKALETLPPGTILDELLIIGPRHTKPRDTDEVPNGYIPIGELPIIQEGKANLTSAQIAIEELCTEAGEPYLIRANFPGTQRLGRFVLATEVEEFLRKKYIDPHTKLTRLDITNFLLEQGWPRLSFDGFIRICDETGATYSLEQKSLNMDAVEAVKVVDYLRGTSFVDPDVELSVSSIAAMLGHKSSTLLHQLMKEDPERYLPHRRTRLSGTPPTHYRAVETLPIEQVVKLIDDACWRWPEVAQYISGRNPYEMVAQIQQRIKRDYWRRKMHPTLSSKAIQAFFSSYFPDTNKTEAGEDPTNKDLQNELLNLYQLSPYGKKWRDFSACADEDPELFFPVSEQGPSIALIKEAKQVCHKCIVRADCLLFSLETGSEGIAGGLTASERAQLPKNIIDTFRHKKD